MQFNELDSYTPSIPPPGQLVQCGIYTGLILRVLNKYVQELI